MDSEASDAKTLGDEIDKLSIKMVREAKNLDTLDKAKIVQEAGRWFQIRYRTGEQVSKEGSFLDVIRREAFDNAGGTGSPGEPQAP